MKTPTISPYTALSTAVFVWIGFGLSRDMFPNSLLIPLGCATVVGVFYWFLHQFMGTGNFEAAIFMAVLLIFLGEVNNAVHAYQKRVVPLPQGAQVENHSAPSSP